MFLMRTRSLAQFGILGLDFLANYVCFGVAIFLLEQLPEQYLSAIPGGPMLYFSMNIYFMLTVPLLSGRTPAMALFNKTVQVYGQKPSVLRNIAHAILYLPTLFIAFYVLIFSHRRAFDVFLNYCMHDLPRLR